MMATKTLGKTVGLLVAMFLAVAIALVSAPSRQALANELETATVSAQSSYTNTVMANAQELAFGESYTGTLDYVTGTTNYEEYWFKFKTSNRDSLYVIQIDALNGGTWHARTVDENGDASNWSTNASYDGAGSGWRVIENRNIFSSSSAPKNTWNYVHIRNRLSSTRYDQYRITVYEKKQLTTENLSIDPTSYTYDGKAKRPATSVTYDGETLVKDVDYSVDYINNVNAGSGMVKITGMGDNYTGEVSTTFEIKPKSAIPSIGLSPSSVAYDGKSHTPTIKVYVDGRELDQSTECEVTHPFGRYGVSEVGTYAVTAKATGNYTGSATAIFEITPKSVTPTVSLSESSFTYDGRPHMPEVTVKDGSTTLSASDYRVTWPSDCTTVGTHRISVALTGSYAGSATATFKVTPQRVAPTVLLSRSSFTYDGKAHMPAVIVRNGSTTFLASGYKVIWPSDCTTVGTHRVTVALTGNYTGSASATFKVSPKGTTVSRVTGTKKGFTVKWKKQAAQTSGYQVQYSSNSRFASAKTLTVKSSKTLSKKVAKLKAKRTYWVRVRTCKIVGKTNYYSSWSSAKKVTTKK